MMSTAMPANVSQCLRLHCTGVGLYRTQRFRRPA